MRSRLALMALVALAAVLAPTEASALTRAQADRVALRTLQPGRRGGEVVLFGLRRPVGAGRVISTFGGPVWRARALRKRTWLFWEDLAYGAELPHASILLLIDDRTGRVIRKVPAGNEPLVDGQPPDFVDALRPNLNEVLYASKVTGLGRARAADSPASGDYKLGGDNGKLETKPGSLNGECVLIAGFRGSAKFQKDFDAIVQWVNDANKAGAGIQGFPAATNNLDGLKAAIEKAKKAGCKDILIYLAGHGIAEPGKKVKEFGEEYVPEDLGWITGEPGVLAGGHIEKGPSGEEKKVPDPIYAKDIKALIDANPDLKFKLKIDACFSQRFVDVLGKQKRLLILEYSSARDEVSYDHLPDGHPLKKDGTPDKSKTIKNNVPSPGPGEATNANVRGLYRWARTASEQTVPDGQGSSPLAWALKEAFRLGNPDNFAQTMGYTHGGVVYPDRDAGGTDGPTACANCNPNAGPHAAFAFSPDNPPSGPKAGQPVSFSGLSSTDAGAPITSYRWSFGPGRSGTGATDSVTFKTPGAYSVTLTVTDLFGKSTTTGHVVFVSGPGTKSSESGVPCNDNGAIVGGIILNVYVPSYAQNVRVAGAGLPTTACNRTGHWTETIGPADPTRIDEWGNVKVNHQFTFTCDTNCDPSATAPVFTLQWD